MGQLPAALPYTTWGQASRVELEDSQGSQSSPGMAPCLLTKSLAPTLTPNQDIFLKIGSLVGVMLVFFVILREVLEAVLERQVRVRTGSSLTVRAPHFPSLDRVPDPVDPGVPNWDTRL